MYKKSGKPLGGALDASRNWQGLNPAGSKTANLLKTTLFRCEVCDGVGHEFFECPTKRKLDAWATKNGDSWEWGKWKGS